MITRTLKKIRPAIIRPVAIAITIVVSTSFLSALAAPTAPGNVTVSGDKTRPTVSWDPSQTDPNGVNWTQVRKNSQVFAPWSGRQEFGTVVFNNKVWVMGGTDNGTNVYNDVWSTSDGANWTQETAHAAWQGRNALAAAVFNNKIWVMGGIKSFSNNYAQIGDVWSSPDGINWTQESASPPWGARAYANAVVFNNKMWLLAGYVGGRKNDVWSTTDGVNWTQETASAAWPGRIRSTTTVFNNKMWIMGGDVGCCTRNDVWSSSDGINWTQETANAAWSDREGHMAAVLNGKIWVMGGVSFSNWASKSDVWSSSDGINWTQETNNAWPGRYSFGLAVLDSQFMVLGAGAHDVWLSSDGVNWAGPGASPGPSWIGRGGPAVLSFNNKIWVMGGYSSNYTNDVWSSSDGFNWTQATGAAPWPARYTHSALVFNNKLWVMGGSSYSGDLHDVWSSSDGVNWTQATAAAAWPVREGAKAVVFNNKIWISGGYDGDLDTKLNDVWSSSDGVTWTQATAAAAWPVRDAHQMLTYNNKLWVLGGSDFNWDSMKDIWNSSDGVTWTQVTADSPWGLRNAHEAQVFDNKMWVMGGYDGNWDEQNDVWSSTDGTNWEKATDNADWPTRSSFGSTVLNNMLWVMGGWNNNDVWSTPNNSVDHYKVCWDTVQGGCTYSANVAPDGTVVASASSKSWLEKLGLVGTAHAAGNQISFTLTNPLSPGTWYFSVAAVTGGGTLSTQSLLTTYSLRPPGAPNTGVLGPVRDVGLPVLVMASGIVGYLRRDWLRRLLGGVV